MTHETHVAADLLTGPTFYHFDHVLELDGTPHKVVAVHGRDSSTAHYWYGRDPSDILLSVRPCVAEARGAVCVGPQRKHMVAPNQPLTALPVAA
jgi:hypothetical protein